MARWTPPLDLAVFIATNTGKNPAAVAVTTIARIRSYLGRLEMDGIQVEIMGDIAKRLDDQTWEAPIKVVQYRRWLEIDGMRVPVLSLAYEYQAYLKLGRMEKADMIRQFLQKTGRT